MKNRIPRLIHEIYHMPTCHMRSYPERYYLIDIPLAFYQMYSTYLNVWIDKFHIIMYYVRRYYKGKSILNVWLQFFFFSQINICHNTPRSKTVVVFIFLDIWLLGNSLDLVKNIVQDDTFDPAAFGL